MTPLATRRRRIGVHSCALSVLAIPCAALAAWGLYAVATARGEWAIFGFVLGGGAVLVGGPGTALGIGRLVVGLQLLRDRPCAVSRAKTLGDVALGFHACFWTMVLLLFARVPLHTNDFSLGFVAVLLGSLALSGVLVGHALAARALARDAEATSSRPSPPSAPPL